MRPEATTTRPEATTTCVEATLTSMEPTAMRLEAAAMSGVKPTPKLEHRTLNVNSTLPLNLKPGILDPKPKTQNPKPKPKIQNPKP